MLNNIFTWLSNKYTKSTSVYGNKLYVDSFFVLNKCGIDDIAYNPQIKKHKTTKVSVICNKFKVLQLMYLTVIYMICFTNIIELEKVLLALSLNSIRDQRK